MSPSSQSRPSPAQLGDHLGVDESFAARRFGQFETKMYPASGAVEAALEKKTGCASMLLVAGCMLWVAKRLERVTDVARCYHAAEALLCYQADPAYFGARTLKEPPWKRPDAPLGAAERAVRSITSRFWSIWAECPGSHSAWPPADEAGRAVTIARVIMGDARPIFDRWVKAMLVRLGNVGKNPKLKVGTVGDFPSPAAYEAQIRVNIGPPLPPELLDVRDLRGELTERERASRFAAFLGAVAWADNPFLASPEQMRAAGFEGVPYEIEDPGPSPAKNTTRAAPVRPETRLEAVSAAVAGEDPYPFLAQLEATKKPGRAALLRTYLTEHAKPASFGPRELILDHALSALVGRSVTAAEGSYVAILEASLDVIGDFSVLLDARRRPAVAGFEHGVEVSSAKDARAILPSLARETNDGVIEITSRGTLLGRVTRKELAAVAERDDFRGITRLVRMIAPSDGTLFDALRYMVQQEDKPWAMSCVLDVSDMTVDIVDARLEAALEAVKDESLRDELSAFCDRHGRSARAWRHRGADRTLPNGRALTFVAGIYDGEGVGMELNVYQVVERTLTDRSKNGS